jgi:hypothetical protein
MSSHYRSTMCECCGIEPALSGDFICEDCFLQMCSAMEGDEESSYIKDDLVSEES